MIATGVMGLMALALQIGTPVSNGGPLGSPADRPSPERSAVGPAGAPAGAPLGVPAAALPDRPVSAATAAGLADVPYAATLTNADLVWIDRSLASFTLREKVAQLVVPYIDGGRPASGSAAWRRARRLVMEDRVGGFIVGVGPGQETVGWLNELQSWTRVPLLMAADLEWGPGTRLRGATVLPINMAIAAAGGPELAYEAGRITGVEARAAGLHMAFAPVADVNVNPANPVINTRSYGSDPSLVSARVTEFIRGARSAGLLTVAKHFPGHGDTETDSHLALAVLLADRPRLNAVELAPFRAAIGAGVEGVMTAHMAVPALDPFARLRPATVSSPILTSLLRDELGFGGLVVTDALHMDGMKGEGGSGEMAVASLAAGADILLMPGSAERAIDGVVQAVHDGLLTEARIDASVRRVLAAKAVVGLPNGASADMVRYRTSAGRYEHEAWSRETAERSITLVRGEPGGLPMAVRGRRILAVVYDDRAGHRRGTAFEESLTEAGARVTMLRLSRRSTAAELERARRAASTADATVFASFSRALPWRGDLGLAGPVAALADELAGAGAVVLSFGDPYLLRQIPSARTYLLAWSEVDTSQRAAADALTGRIPVTGTLPIDLPPNYRIGHGLVVPSLPGVTVPRSP